MRARTGAVKAATTTTRHVIQQMTDPPAHTHAPFISPTDKKGGKQQGKVLRLSVLDTNVTLEQLDFLENGDVRVFWGRVYFWRCGSGLGWVPCGRIRPKLTYQQPPVPPPPNTTKTPFTKAAGKVLGACVVPQTVVEETRANSLAAYRCVLEGEKSVYVCVHVWFV